ncbi:sensor histidine kinase [Acetivibrio mesophilus]|uniref:histidine kinase n=1 Tax=Acetivibrio mesophilus TaxID=2487273 RepID=A0A4Q0I4P1_9FIRM|nr:HAMP domain-containing sensor histidine kinase [Acetivibrio mesophilus]ODM26852.1 histidine kinase [Clostridium sp. Bc-iso-3]RXE59283.1 sensor histidine kinase [Acetivibrio mesophilus]HHV28356.1 HAMP domain-containing histidine kinase [Clostridium sp.]
MNQSWKIFKRYAPWLLLLLCVDGLAAVLLWLADIQAFYSLMAFIILATILLFSVVFVVVCYHEHRKEQAFESFLSNPDELNEKTLLKLSSDAEREMILLLGRVLREKNDSIEQLLTRVLDYEEYVEAWAHETKTPLSLLTMLLDNRREELPENFAFKLDYIRNRMQEFINQMLFYSRLKGSQKDYLFEHINLSTFIKEVLEDYLPLLEEKQFQIMMQVPDIFVYSDKRGLNFLISQIISNSIKYSCTTNIPELSIKAFKTDHSYVLSIGDNGIGVHSCDLPYIFEKGFTGDSGDGRKKATGMGLYLAKEIAKDLNIILNVESEWGKGFTMEIAFPIVDDPHS